MLEGIGTAILFAAINFSDGNLLVVATGILTAAVLSGRLTGAHFNSALTIAVLIVEGFDKIRANLKLAIVMIVS
jgi:glycerol uptake facilitator-like aquaporin